MAMKRADRMTALGTALTALRLIARGAVPASGTCVGLGEAMALGWVAPQAIGAAWRITPAGLAALRRSRGGDAPPEASIATARSAGDSPLAWLNTRRDRKGRRFIDDVQREAGERFEADFRFAQMGPRMTAAWGAPRPVGGTARSAPGLGVEIADSVADARRRVENALAALGPGLADIVFDVCGLMLGVEEAERRKGWPPRSGKIVLALALTRLALHYGLPARGAEGVHWAAPGSRPTLDNWR